MWKTQIVRARWEIKLADLWVGIFIRLDYPDLDLDVVQKCVHIWICFLPCLPLHLQVVLSLRWYASWWLLRIPCDSEMGLNAWEKRFYALKALWCLWACPTRRSVEGEAIVAAVWGVYAGGDFHAWNEVRVGDGVFRSWWAAISRESD